MRNLATGNVYRLLPDAGKHLRLDQGEVRDVARSEQRALALVCASPLTWLKGVQQ
jgi:hypothetical protein